MNAKKKIVPEYENPETSLFPTDIGLFRYFVGGPWNGKKEMWSWDDDRSQRLLGVDTVEELEKILDEMVKLCLSNKKRSDANPELHEAEIVEASEVMIYAIQLLRILDPKQQTAKAKKHPVYKLLKNNPQALICLAVTLGQLSIVAKYREAERQYRRGRTRYDHIKQANNAKAAAGEGPPSKEKFLELVKTAKSLYKKKENQTTWLMEALGRKRATIHRYYKRFGVS